MAVFVSPGPPVSQASRPCATVAAAAVGAILVGGLSCSASIVALAFQKCQSLLGFLLIILGFVSLRAFVVHGILAAFPRFRAFFIPRYSLPLEVFAGWGILGFAAALFAWTLACIVRESA